MKILCVIPSRIGSTRLPRKPLLLIRGKPMVQWVYENAKKCTAISEVVVATDSEEIANVIHQVGGKTLLTPADIPTGSDRVAFVSKNWARSNSSGVFISKVLSAVKQTLILYPCSMARNCSNDSALSSGV